MRGYRLSSFASSAAGLVFTRDLGRASARSENPGNFAPREDDAALAAIGQA